MALEEASDVQLFTMTRAGEEAAFVALYRRWQGNVFRFALRVSSSVSVAEDVTQEVFLTLIGGRLRFDPAIGPYSPSGPVRKTVSINDPVAGVNYMLDPDSRSAIMNKYPSGSESAHVVATPFGYVVTSPKTATAGGTGIVSGGGVVVSSESSGLVAFGTTVAPARPGYEPNVRTESLGMQMIEEIQAEGTRIIETIPTGSIGNDSPIEIVSERWYSPELEMIVKSTRNDPMSGENVYQLKNIRRGDPPASLFQVPAEYTIKEGPAIKMQTIKKDGNQ